MQKQVDTIYSFQSVEMETFLVNYTDVVRLRTIELCPRQNCIHTPNFKTN